MKIAWTPLALSDLHNAYDYIAEERASSAAYVIARIEEAVQALARYPTMGRPGRVEGTRELVASDTPFIIAYRVKEKRVEILSVIHTARTRPEEL